MGDDLGVWRPAGVLTLGAALILGVGVAGPPMASAQVGSGSGSDPARPAVLGSGPGAPEVLGLIVRTVSPTVSNRSLELTMMRAGADVATDRLITPTLGVIDFEQPMSFAEAAPIMAALDARPDVIAVGPNRRVYPAVTPSIPNDPLFGQQWDMWDGGGSGDYSTRAAQMWSTTRGSADVVVGVIDTGATNHPDLVGTTVPGFDFISNAADARDGDRWDADPSDEGDWCPGESSSSWHGTHVAGTINAVQDNGIGVTGLAPNVKVQHLRTLGACGGTGADILAAVIWGSGGDLSDWGIDVPGQDPGINPTPASVLNLSLGGADSCDPVSQQIFDEARARGVTIVVAAGNESENVSTSWPANCQRVVAVAASTRNGALSGYSNFGTSPGQIALTSPGNSIFSTYNTGTTVPGSPDYAYASGTSMAAPHVAAAAAILYSLGLTRPAEIEAALSGSVRPFNPANPCSIARCGAGLLDVNRLTTFQPIAVPGAPTDVTAEPVTTTSAVLQWSAPANDGGQAITSYVVRASRDGQAYVDVATTDTAVTTTDVTALVPGATYTFEVAAINSTGVGASSSASAPITMPTEVITVPGRVSGFSLSRFLRSGTLYRVSVRWQAPVNDGGSAVTGYLARVGTGGRWNSWTDVASAQARIVGMKRGTTYRVQVRAVNEMGAGPRAGYSFTTPRR